MSSKSHRRSQMSGMPKPTTDQIKLTEQFSEQMAKLCLNDDYADVVFIVENERLPAHRVILATRSEYFRALLYGGLSETNQRDITLKIPLAAFKALLKYIYSGHMPLGQMSEDHILDSLGLAHQYGFLELEQAISDYLRNCLAVQNVCAVLDAAQLYSLDELSEVCLIFLDRNALEILQHESFKSLSKQSLIEVLQRDSFFAPEVEIFNAVSAWCKFNSNTDFESVVSYVRMPLIELHHLLHVVRPSGILDPNKLLDAIEQQIMGKDLHYRAALWPELNLATENFGASVIQGECRDVLLDGDNTSYDLEKGYSRHYINSLESSSIMVDLGTICMINHIKLLLWDRDIRAYSYYVEVSVDRVKWERVVDYSQYHCRSWQFLYFKTRPVRFINLVGTHNTVNKVFHVVSLEAMYTATMPNLVGDIVTPTANIATVEMSAVVVDGVSRTRNALLNGDFYNYDWDSGYTCHQLGSGEILVRLGQPYILNSMRLLLWDCDNRSYSYYIETSVNQKDWDKVVDKQEEDCRSWQNFSFTPRPVVFIRIVGTRNTANEIFHCVHLECPSQDAHFLQQLKNKDKHNSFQKKVVQCLTPLVDLEEEADLVDLSANENEAAAGDH